MSRIGFKSSIIALALALVACSGDDGADGAPSGADAGAAGSAGGGGWPSTDAGVDAGGGAAGASGSSAGSGGSAGAGGANSTPPPADCPRVRVDVPAGEVLNVRPDPSTKNPPVGTLAAGEVVDVLAFVTGEAIGGVDLWYQIKSPKLSGFVFSGFAMCTTDEPWSTKPGFWLPLACGKSAKVTQGNFGSYSHQGNSAYAFDFSLGIGTSMTAMADGTVSYVYDKTKPGDPCYDGGDSTCISKANIVLLQHADGTKTHYAHLSKVLVTVGQAVGRGTPVGLSGSTGYSTGPHAHVARSKDGVQSIPLAFQDVPGSGVPSTGQTVTSGNCP